MGYSLSKVKDDNAIRGRSTKKNRKASKNKFLDKAKDDLCWLQHIQNIHTNFSG